MCIRDSSQMFRVLLLVSFDFSYFSLLLLLGYARQIKLILVDTSSFIQTPIAFHSRSVECWCCADISISASRELVLHGDTELSFSQARSTCIIEGGDLAATESTAIIDDVVKIIKEVVNSAAYVYTKTVT